MPKKILILYTSIGLGHKSIAGNIGYHLQTAGYEVKLHDVLQLQAGALVSVGTIVHRFINEYVPFVWKWLYVHTHSGWFSNLTLPNRVKVASRNYHQVKTVIDEYHPDLVIATQTNASAIIQYLKQQHWYNGLFGIAFSDYHLHRYWLYKAADFYLANTEEQKQEMIELGIAAEKIFVLGITLKPRAEVDALAVRQRLGLKPDERVVLVASGSLGTGISTQWFIKLAQEMQKLPNTKTLIVCGKNQQLQSTLQSQVASDRVLVFGYYSPLAEFYAISDLMLSKPGGLTMAETLQWRLPVLVIHWLAGGEEPNYDYLKGKRLLIEKPTSVEPSKLKPIIEQELTEHGFKQSLISNPALLELTQSGQEGQRLIKAVDLMFHKV